MLGLHLGPLYVLLRVRDRHPRLLRRPPRRALRVLSARERLARRGDARVLAVATVEEAAAAGALWGPPDAVALGRGGRGGRRAAVEEAALGGVACSRGRGVAFYGAPGFGGVGGVFFSPVKEAHLGGEVYEIILCCLVV